MLLDLCHTNMSLTIHLEIKNIMNKFIFYVCLFFLGFQCIAQQKKTHEFDEQNRLSKVFYWNDINGY